MIVYNLAVLSSFLFWDLARYEIISSQVGVYDSWGAWDLIVNGNKRTFWFSIVSRLGSVMNLREPTLLVWYLSKSENVKVNFLTKNDTLIYNIENKKIKLNEIQIEYLNDFLKNLRDLKLQSNDLIFSFNLCLPENLYILGSPKNY